MNEFDNDKLVSAFENVTVIFSDHIKPYAIEMC